MIFQSLLGPSLRQLLWHQTCFHLVAYKPAGFDNSELSDCPVEVIADGPETSLCVLAAAVVTEPVDARRSPLRPAVVVRALSPTVGGLHDVHGRNLSSRTPFANRFEASLC